MQFNSWKNVYVHQNDFMQQAPLMRVLILRGGFYYFIIFNALHLSLVILSFMPNTYTSQSKKKNRISSKRKSQKTQQKHENINALQQNHVEDMR